MVSQFCRKGVLNAETCPYLNVPRSEKELTIQVTLLNDVHVSDVDHTPFTTSHAHHGKVLEQFAAYCTCSNLEKYGEGGGKGGRGRGRGEEKKIKK